MEKLVVDRHASDNKYLHKDFHLSIDLSLDYVGNRFGEEGVREYLETYAGAYYLPLIERIRKEGLEPIKEYLEEIYGTEEAADAIRMVLTDNKLEVETAYCPGLRHMLAQSHTPSKWYIETTRTVYGTIAKNAGLDFVLHSYEDKTGASSFVFSKKEVPAL